MFQCNDQFFCIKHKWSITQIYYFQILATFSIFDALTKKSWSLTSPQIDMITEEVTECVIERLVELETGGIAHEPFD